MIERKTKDYFRRWSEAERKIKKMFKQQPVSGKYRNVIPA
jgi:hypothetical protein